MKRVNKKKKAFTLIELLAVIVILGIIATIVTATISKVTSNAKKQAFKESARGLIRAAESYMGEYILKNHQAPEFPMTFTCDGTSCKYQDIELDFSGEIPKSGAIIADGLKKVEASYLSDGKYCAAGTKTDMQVADSCADIDMTKPTVTGVAEGLVLKLTMSDVGSGIGSYCVTTANDSSSCSWIDTTDTYKEHTVASAGTYYVFAKDKKGNVSNYLQLEAIFTFAQTILRDNPTVKNNPDLTSTSSSSNQNGLYVSTATNSGDPTYYFRGNVSNNYVSFANKIWRIVRINEDNTIRLILEDAIDDVDRGFVSEENSVGYEKMYYSNSDVAKPIMEDWYLSNIVDTGFSNKIANKNGNYFCESAKTVYSKNFNTSSGTSFMSTYTSYTPTFTCNEDANGYQYADTNIGFITYDEVVMAGGYPKSENTSFYLYKSVYNWLTMSPSGIRTDTGNKALIWWVCSDAHWMWADYGANSAWFRYRPVINLKANVTVTGTGISTDPYVVD